MKKSKESQKMYDLAEEIVLEDFNQEGLQHEFSDTYKHKKKLFLEEIKKKEQPKIKRKKSRVLIAAACLLIGIPTTAFGAAKVYDMIVQKQNYEVNVSVVNNSSKSNDWYKLKLNYLPKNMEAIDNTGGMKYSFKDNFAQGGFSFILWRLGDNSDFQTLYSKSYEEKKINGREVVIVDQDTGNDNIMFDRQVFLLFKEEGIMLESYVGTDVNEEQLIKVIENISLVPTTKEKSTDILDYDKAQMVNNENQPGISIIPLKKDSSRLFNIGEVFSVSIDQIVNGKIDTLEYVVEKVEVFDSINDFTQENFNEFGLDILKRNKALDQTNKLLPYTRNVYQSGNGKDSLDQLVESKQVKPKFVYLTTKVKNIGKEATEEIYMSPTVKVLKSEEDAWNYAGEEGISEHSIMTGEVDYLEPHGKGKSFYNIGSIKPGQTMTINLGYFVDEDKMDSIFLDAFHYTGSGETEDLNAAYRWWIDVRQ